MRRSSTGRVNAVDIRWYDGRCASGCCVSPPTRTAFSTIWRPWIGESIKSMQKALDRPFDRGGSVRGSGGQREIRVFTTRPVRFFGATYMVLAPEHPLVETITSADQLEEVRAYVKEASTKSEMERTELAKEKTGVFTGGYAVNPVNGEHVPVWISDYVLATYGTGAIMAVPGHDERDFEFATRFQIEVRRVVAEGEEEAHSPLEEAFTGKGVAVNSDFLNGLKTDDAKEAMIDWLESNGKGERSVNYRLRDWNFSRQRYWGEPFPLLHDEDGNIIPLEEDQLPLALPEVESYEPTGTGESPLAGIREWVEVVDPETGKKFIRETNTMPQWAGSCWYYLRYIDPHNSERPWDREKEKYWMPVDLYVGGAEHAVLHLLYARFWHKVLFDLGEVSTEPFGRLVNQGLI